MYSDSGQWAVVSQSVLHADLEASPDGSVRWGCEAEVNETGTETRVKITWGCGTRPLGFKLQIMLGRDRLLDSL